MREKCIYERNVFMIYVKHQKYWQIRYLLLTSRCWSGIEMRRSVRAIEYH